MVIRTEMGTTETNRNTKTTNETSEDRTSININRVILGFLIFY